MNSRIPVLLLVTAGLASAQNGDQEGEPQPPLPDHIVVPPAPPLSAADELSTLRVPPGYTVELVCAEPLVVDPVVATFDELGRLWVCEMRGYMPNADGENEHEPVGCIAVLEDEDGDGTFEKRTDFLDDLVLPRAVLPTRGGALVIAPPDLLFCEDTDGDGRADERTVIATGLAGLENPEHAINGLMTGLDNWIRCANSDQRWRFVGDEWTVGRTAGGGQWGITRDDLGLAYFNTNSALLRGDRVPSHYLVRNPNHGHAAGGNTGFLGQAPVRSARVNTGVNRGYRGRTLAEDGHLDEITGACGPLIYRGDALPELRGNAFVCEPAGNLVKRLEFFVDDDGVTRARSLHEPLDFLTSTDERFRPVNLFDGPDGCLYVVDFYRGIIQHRIYMTSWLRKQVDERGLAEPVGLGRIWRIRPAEWERPEPPDFAEASWTQVVAALSHANGWVRDAAQKILVEEGRGSHDAHELVREAVAGAPTELGRMHALWALEGMGGIDLEVLRGAWKDESSAVRHAAVRTSEKLLAAGNARALGALARMANTADPHLLHQITLSLGEARTQGGLRALARMLILDASTPEMRSAVLSGLAGRELAFLQGTLGMQDWKEERPGRAKAIRLLARAVAREGRGDRIEGVLGLCVRGLPDWHVPQLVGGLLDGRPKGPDGKPTYLHVPARPQAFDALAQRDDDDTRALLAVLAWPGREGLEAFEVVPLDAEQELRFARGAVIYADVCAACHQPSGLGEAGKAPPLRHSDWVLGPPERLIRIVAHGLHGPVEVQGTTWDLDMPAFVASDTDLASILTYVRREWGHGVAPIDPPAVRAVLDAAGPRGPWTAEELAGR